MFMSHHQAERQIHLCGKASSAEAAVGMTALLDTSVEIRATVFKEMQLEERDNRPRSNPPTIIGKEKMLIKLEKSGFLKVGGMKGDRTEVMNFEGKLMAKDAEDIEKQGQDALTKYAIAMRAGAWYTHKLQPKWPVTREEGQKKAAADAKQANNPAGQTARAYITLPQRKELRGLLPGGGDITFAQLGGGLDASGVQMGSGGVGGGRRSNRQSWGGGA